MNAGAKAGHIPKHVVILCHPQAESFNASVARTYCETVREIGHEVVLRDLYRMSFDPVLKAVEQPGKKEFELADDVADELTEIQGANIFVFVYPIWFGTPPAMLKGYVERVLGAGFSYRAIKARQYHPLLNGAWLLSFSSSGSTEQWLEEQGAWRSLRQVFDKYLATAFSFDRHEHDHFSAIVSGMKARFVEENLEDVRQKARQICSELASAHRVAPIATSVMH